MPGSRTILLAVVASLVGCTAYMHGYTLQRFTNRTLSPESEDGQYRLELESGIDYAIRGHLSTDGPPDYFRVVDTNTVYFFYLEDDRVVKFERSWSNPNSNVTFHQPIPNEMASWLPIDAASTHPPENEPVVSKFDQCFNKCVELTSRTNEECFDICRE